MFVNDEEFVALKARYNEYAACEFPNCDKLMIPVLQKINTLCGVTTIFCCEGHYGPDNYEDTGTRIYILLAIAEDGLPVIRKLYEQLRQKLNMTHRFDLTFQQSIWPIGENIQNYAQFLSAKTYTSCCLADVLTNLTRGMFEDCKLEFLQAVCDSVDNINC
ncbi:MAG: hypothetical protein PHQ58_05105 [Rhodoferax sp.]|uniref:hypothetical protein n=1 Tax=Rhodoferax sp. TaxID=50421 RepID=UPI0026156F6F|nr:hypothetical protein [Rhodoferax sp.]MDD2879793.1 hypothetical protein [Rhodoferax sp.]